MFIILSANKTCSNRKSRGRRASEDDDSDEDAQFVAGGAKDAAVGPLSAEAREALELQFERTMQDYEDDEIGYIDYVSAFFAMIWSLSSAPNLINMFFCLHAAVGRGGLRR